VGASHPGLHQPEPYFLLNALGVQAYRRLEAEYDLGPWFARTGCLTWSSDLAEQEATAGNVAYLSGRGYNAALLSPARAAHLEPAAALPESCGAAIR
jgi:glycine/D-amino acid oxidase-like deaminating enzyme